MAKAQPSKTGRPGSRGADQGPAARSAFADERALLAAADAIKAGRPIAFEDPRDRLFVWNVLSAVWCAMAERDRRRSATALFAKLCDYWMRDAGVSRQDALLKVAENADGTTDWKRFARVAKALDRLHVKQRARKKNTTRKTKRA